MIVVPGPHHEMDDPEHLQRLQQALRSFSGDAAQHIRHNAVPARGRSLCIAVGQPLHGGKDLFLAEQIVLLLRLAFFGKLRRPLPELPAFRIKAVRHQHPVIHVDVADLALFMEPVRLFELGDLFLRIELRQNGDRPHKRDPLLRENDGSLVFHHIQQPRNAALQRRRVLPVKPFRHFVGVDRRLAQGMVRFPFDKECSEFSDPVGHNTLHSNP